MAQRVAKTTDPVPAPLPVPTPPPLPADVTSVGWWQAIAAWAVTTAAWVAVLIGHPFGSTTLTEVTTAAGILASVAPIIAALVTHGQVKKAVIGYHAAALSSDRGLAGVNLIVAVLAVVIIAVLLSGFVHPLFLLLLLLIVLVLFL